MMSYDCKFKDEVLDAIEWCEKEIQLIRSSGSMYDTFTICKFYSLAIHQQIKGSYSSLKDKNLLTHRILFRSIAEYVIEQRLISNRNDITTNKLFANYHILKAYWYLNDIDFYKDSKEVIKENYISYLTNFPVEIVVEPIKTSITQDFVTLVGKKIKSKYKHSWIGLDFQQKLRTVLIESIIGYGDYNAISLWDQAKNALENNDKEEWNTMGSMSKINKICNFIYEKCDTPKIKNINELNDFLVVFEKSFRTDSNSTHPTSYSIYPHINPTGKFEYSNEFDFSNDLFLEAEEALYIAFYLSFESVISILPQNQRDELLNSFTNYSKKHKKIQSHFETKYGKNANSTGDK